MSPRARMIAFATYTIVHVAVSASCLPNDDGTDPGDASATDGRAIDGDADARDAAGAETEGGKGTTDASVDGASNPADADGSIDAEALSDASVSPETGDASTTDGAVPAPASACFRTFPFLRRQVATDVAIDAHGHIAITGIFGGTIDFGTGPLVSTNDETNLDSSFLAIFDASCNAIFAKRFDTLIRKVSFAPNGLLWVAGETRTTKRVVVLQAFDVNGAAAGSLQYTSATGSYGASLSQFTIDHAGNLVFGGTYYEPVDFGGGPLPTPPYPNRPYGFVAKVSPAGTHVWSRALYGVPIVPQYSVSVETLGIAANDDVLVAGGYVNVPVDLGGGPLRSDGNAYLVRYQGSDGSHVWSHGHPYLSEFGAAPPRERGGIWPIGGVQSQLYDFGQGPIRGPFLAGVDTSTGNFAWSYGVSAGANDQISTMALAFRSDGSLLFSGRTQSNTMVGAPPVYVHKDFFGRATAAGQQGPITLITNDSFHGALGTLGPGDRTVVFGSYETSITYGGVTKPGAETRRPVPQPPPVEDLYLIQIP